MADVDFELRCDPSGLVRTTWDSAELAPDQTSKHALVFSIAEQNFAIAADFIEQIVELPRIVHVPSSGPTLLGLADLTGKPIPVVDIAPLLNLDTALDGFRHGLASESQRPEGDACDRIGSGAQRINKRPGR